MKIIYHHRTLGDGAEGIHIREIIRSFRKLGHEVLPAGPTGEAEPTPGGGPGKLSHIKRMMPGFAFEMAEIGYNLAGFAELAAKIRTFRPDFIYDRYITYNASAVVAGMLFKLPVFLEVNSPLALERDQQPDEQLYFKGMAYRLERWICSRSARTLVVSTPLARYLQSLGVPAEKLCVMPNGTDRDKFVPRPKEEALLQEIGAKSGEVIIAFTGVLRPWHGLELLIRSVGNLRAAGHSVRLLIIGDGPIREQVEGMIADAGLIDNAAITGMLGHRDVPRYLNLSDITVSPRSTFYASPMKVIEYMGMGKTVVVPHRENFLDIIDPGVNGEVFTDGDEGSLTRTLAELCDNAGKRDALGGNARLKVERRLNWDWNAQAVCDMAAGMIRNGKSTRKPAAA